MARNHEDTKARDTADAEMSALALGSITIAPHGPVEAGCSGTWTLTYTAGAYGIDDGGALLVAARQISDWGPPQTDDPSAANYVRVTTTAPATLKATYSSKAHIRPWRQGIIVSVVDGHIAAGETITVVLGDRTSGGLGFWMQTFPERHFDLHVLVDCFGSGDYRALATQPSLMIVAGAATRLVAIGAATARPGKPAWLLIRALDRWGNIAPSYDGTVEFGTSDDGIHSPPPYRFQPEDRGFHRFEGIRFDRPGIYRLAVRDPRAGFAATANPCICQSTDDGAPLALYWGDLHGQSEETIGTGDVESYWAYLRDAAGADFGGHCGNDFQITSDFYQRLRGLVQRYHEPGRFVSFLSYEWSGNHGAGGDHNVYFLHDDPARSEIHRSSHWQIADHSDTDTDRYPISALRDEMRSRDDVLILPHVGGRRAKLDTVDDVCQSPVIEISSVHGRFPWFAREAMEDGLKVGFIAGSDDHTGRPGASPPTRRGLICWGGLTGVYAPALTRAALWSALKQRHCYGTTGPRIIVSFGSDGHLMGDEISTHAPPHFHGRVAGTAPIERIELRRGLDVIWQYDAIGAPPPSWQEATMQARLRLTWSGAESKNRTKVTTWDGHLTLDGGRILNASPYHLDHPAEGITAWEAESVAWRSQTSGDEDGVILDLEIAHDAVVHLDTPSLRRSFVVRELGTEPLIVNTGAADRQVILRWVRADAGPLDVDWSFVDEQPPSGEHAYWVWIVQVDGEWAWSSPIFVTVP